MAESFFTSGLSFPLMVNAGKPVITTGVDLIKSSIKIILSWPLFTRIFQPDFGSRVFETIEEPNDQILLNLMDTFIVMALEKWEPRITILHIEIQRTSATAIKADIFYRVKELSIQDSTSYTFNY